MTRLLDWAILLMSRIPHSLIGLLGRLSIALVFWNSGRTKVAGWNLFHVNENTLALFQEEYRLPYAPPELAALAAQIAEHVLAALLVIGLARVFPPWDC